MSKMRRTKVAINCHGLSPGPNDSNGPGKEAGRSKKDKSNWDKEQEDQRTRSRKIKE